MRTHHLLAALCVSTLAACGSPAPPPDAQPPASPAPSAESEKPDATPPAPSPAEPAQPAPEAPAPSEPSPTAKPTSTAEHLVAEPPLAAMKPAIRSAKMTVPVDLNYRFSADPVTGQPTTLYLAAVPRVAGTNLAVSIKNEPGIHAQMAPGNANIQKASAAGVYRKQASVTRIDPEARRVRVLVTMDLPYGSGFGFFSIPLDGAQAGSSAVNQRDLVKQR